MSNAAVPECLTVSVHYNLQNFFHGWSLCVSLKHNFIPYCHRSAINGGVEFIPVALLEFLFGNHLPTCHVGEDSLRHHNFRLDLNPIEHVWDYLDWWVQQRNPTMCWRDFWLKSGKEVHKVIWTPWLSALELLLKAKEVRRNINYFDELFALCFI